MRTASIAARTGWGMGIRHYLEKLQQARCAIRVCTDVIPRQVLRRPSLYHPLSSRFPFIPTTSHQQDGTSSRMG